MLKSKPLLLIFIFSFLLNACTVLPEGPAVSTLPGSKKTVASFAKDDFRCQDYAKQQSGNLTPNQAKEEVTGEHAFVGALIGAFLGIAIGHNPRDAAIGAATGALFGGLSGSDKGNVVAADIQYDYDRAYTKCMYSAGHRVPARHVQFIEPYIEKHIEQAPKKPTAYGVPPDYRLPKGVPADFRSQ